MEAEEKENEEEEEEEEKRGMRKKKREKDYGGDFIFLFINPLPLCCFPLVLHLRRNCMPIIWPSQISGLKL